MIEIGFALAVVEQLRSTRQAIHPDSSQGADPSLGRPGQGQEEGEAGRARKKGPPTKGRTRKGVPGGRAQMVGETRYQLNMAYYGGVRGGAYFIHAPVR